MLSTTIAALLLPVAILAAPANTNPNKDNQCRPLAYIFTEYTLSKSPSYYFVSFNAQSLYSTGTQVDDKVKAVVNCEADGTEIHPSGNSCNFGGKKFDKLLFDLWEDSGDAAYRLYHKWQCNGCEASTVPTCYRPGNVDLPSGSETWASENDIEFPDLKCKTISKEEGAFRCISRPITVAPQNVRKISDTDKEAANKTGIAKPPAQAKAKSADCHDCKPSASL